VNRPVISVTVGNLPPDLKKQEDLVKRQVIQAVRQWTDVIDCHASASLEVLFHVEVVVAGDPAKLGFGKSVVSDSFNGEKKGWQGGQGAGNGGGTAHRTRPQWGGAGY
jgi:hypothetical protein